MAELIEKAKAETNVSDLPLGAGLAVAAGQFWERKKDPGRAQLEYERAMALEPQRPEGYVALMQLLVAEKRPDEAIEVCQRMADQPQLAYSAWVSRGNLLIEKQSPSEAEAAFRKALRLAPGESDAYEQLGQILISQGRPEDAAKVYRQMVKQPGLAWQAQILLGDLWVGQEKPKQAEKAYRQAINADPQQPGGYLRLAQLYQQQGDLDRAEALIEEAKTAAPDSSDPSVVLAQLREQQGKVDDAIALYRQLAQLRPEEASTAYERTGDLLIAQQRYAEAAAALQQALQKNPANAGAYFSLGKTYEQQANSEQAVAMYGRAIDIDSKYFSAYEALLRMFAKRQEAAKIADLSARLLGQTLGTVDHYNAYTAIGAAYQEAQALEWATDAFKAAQDLDPTRTEAYLALGQVYEMQKRWVDARTIYGKLDELVPAWRPDVHRKLGDLYALEGLFAEAEQEYHKVVTLAPEHPYGYYGLAQVYMTQEQWPQAAETWEKLTQLKEVDPVATCSAYLYLADIRRTLGNMDAMSAACSKVIGIVDALGSPNSDLLRQKGLALFMTGQYDRARGPLVLGLEADPKDVRALLYLALNLLGQGRRTEAEQCLRQAMAHASHEAEFDSAIREAKVLAASMPEIPSAKETVEALQKAAAAAVQQPK